MSLEDLTDALSQMDVDPGMQNLIRDLETAFDEEEEVKSAVARAWFELEKAKVSLARKKAKRIARQRAVEDELSNLFEKLDTKEDRPPRITKAKRGLGPRRHIRTRRSMVQPPYSIRGPLYR